METLSRCYVLMDVCKRWHRIFRRSKDPRSPEALARSTTQEKEEWETPNLYLDIRVREITTLNVDSCKALLILL